METGASETTITPRPNAWARVAWLALAVCVALLLVDLPRHVPGAGLDDSWMAAYGHFFKHKFQAGTDYVFTYGPLGLLLFPVYVVDLFWAKLLAELAVKLVFGLTVVELFRSQAPGAARLALGLTLLIFAQFIADRFDALYTAVALMHLLRLVDSPPAAVRFSDVCRCVLLGLLSLTKFTLVSFIGVSVLMILAYFIASRRWRDAGVVALTHIVTFVIGWLALGQDLRNVPAYLATSIELTLGYSEAMALVGPPLELYLGLAIVLLALFAVLSGVRTGCLQLAQLTKIGLLALGIAVAWKQGFVRHDKWHAGIFFAFAIWIPFLLPSVVLLSVWRRPATKLLWTALAIVAVGSCWYSCNVRNGWTHLVRNVKGVTAPARMMHELEEQRRFVAAQWSLPRARAVTGDASVDLFSHEQGVALMNGFNWHPRPVFQSYSAYTPALAARNARFFDRDGAPDFVLFKLQTIDTRLPMLDDGDSILRILRNYRPLLSEQSFVLFQKSGNGSRDHVPTGTPVERRRIKFDEEVSLDSSNGSPIRVALDFRHSAGGKLCKLIHKVPHLSIRVRTADSQTSTYRINPAMARAGFLLSPLITNTRDILDLYGDAGGKRVVSFCVVSDHDTRAYYKSHVRMTVEQTELEVCAKLDQRQLTRLKYPQFEPTPEAMQSVLVWPTDVHGQHVVVVHPDGVVKLAVAPGARAIKGLYGIHPFAYESGITDGVRFVVEFLTADGKVEVLFERDLDPVANGQDRGIHPLEIPLPAHGEGYVVLKTANAPGRHVLWDWSYWSDIRVE